VAVGGGMIALLVGLWFATRKKETHDEQD
jgi:hypothetical protein